MKPNITEQVDGYILVWEDQHISIRVSRIKVHKDGRVIGELLITTDSQGFAPILMPASQLNFNAERTRNSLIKSLNDKFPKFDWTTIIDELAHYIQELARQGEPVKELWTHDDVKSPEYLLEPFIFKGLPNVIYGEKGVNKSTLALVFYICLTLPWYDNPLELKVPSKSVPTLLLDWETEWDISQYYAKRIQTGMGLPTFPVYYRRCFLPLADDVEQIQGHINKMKAEAVIVDSLGAAAGGDLKTAEIALGFFSALRRLKVSSLIIAQTTKDEESQRKRIFGSHFFEYYSRNMWEIVKAESISDEEYNIALFHRSPNLTALLKPIGFHLHYNETGLTIARQSVNLGEFIARITTRQRILEHLKNEGLKTTAEIVDSLSITRTNADVTLKRLREGGKVVKVDDKWGLKAFE